GASRDPNAIITQTPPKNTQTLPSTTPNPTPQPRSTSSSGGGSRGSAPNVTISSQAQQRFGSEQVEAFIRARANGITTIDDMDVSRPNGELLRRDLAKMLVEFNRNVLNNDETINESCRFGDIAGQTQEMKDFIIRACEMGLMGLKADGTPDTLFNPNNIVTRAEFGTTLSRIYFGDKYNIDLDELQRLNDSGVRRYTRHLEALQTHGIMKFITPERANASEKRGLTWIVLQRASTLLTFNK
ncbi:MAG: S-layer homology domain-containing protein, partial [Candidatus Absconditabacterales bacterium]|nr:S-layer homology domain-containing protein [Candidatus Absconditabacterales bacterium]